MIEKFLFLISITLILSVITEETEKKNIIEADTNPIYVDYNILYLQKNFVAFKEAVAFKESQGKYKVINTLGYLGKYQFGTTTLERFRIYNTKAFLNNPEQQEKAFIALCSVNKWILRKDIKRSVGKTINGIKITESGILASAHLSGAGNVKKFLRSNGTVHFKDAFGATIQMYMKKFSGYDVSFIKANRKAKV
ncbi:peptidoglycan-binding protein LysM [Polaribacter sp.]|uniref:peptidoglycan-binding protein LysM n=1 Tax=Polaribacter sp. TaxID=1920175 RepID=UPI0025DF560A|nr:peptidoglycan-binding protein LysM [Polaribacter sp.]